VILVNLLAAVNFVNVFSKIKNVWKIKNVKNVKNVTKIKKRKKTFFLHLCRDQRSCFYWNAVYDMVYGQQYAEIWRSHDVIWQGTDNGASASLDHHCGTLYH